MEWRSRVNAASLRVDLAAGAIGAIVVLPQGIAFGTLAGLGPEYGLYCAIIPAIVAALFGSSWHAVSGPTNAVSLFIFATLAPLAAPGSPEYLQLAFTLAFMSGALMLAMGIARMGALVNFISHTVVVGFTAGAAVLIFASQLGPFFGVELPRDVHLLQRLWSFVTRPYEIQPAVLAVGLVTAAAGIAARRWLPWIPYMIIAVAAGILLGAALSTGRAGEIPMVGVIPASLPPLSIPDFSAETWRALSGIAIAVTVLSLTEAISVGRAVALRSGQRIDANQEFIGQGLSNVAASFFSGFPSSASFNRSGLNYEAGAQTPLAAVFSAMLLAALVMLFAPLVGYIPIPAVAGLLFLVAWGLIDFRHIRHVLATSRSESGVLAVTFVATLLLSLEIAIFAGIIFSLLIHLSQTSHPAMRSLVPDPRHPERKMAEVEDGLPECPQMKILRIEGSLYYGAMEHVSRHFDTLRAVAPGQKHLLVMAKSINTIDLQGADLLRHEARLRRAAGGDIYFYSLRKPVERMFEQGGYMDEFGRDHVFRGKREAFGGVFQRLDRSICRTCTARIFEECAAIEPPGLPVKP